MSDFSRVGSGKGSKSSILDTFGGFLRTFRGSGQIQSGKWHGFEKSSQDPSKRGKSAILDSFGDFWTDF